MNISVSLRSDTALLQHAAMSAVPKKPVAAVKADVTQLKQAQPSLNDQNKDSQNKNQAFSHVANDNQASNQPAAHNSNQSGQIHLKVNNPDYKIKMLIEQQIGTSTIQTELNFYHQPGTYNISGTPQEPTSQAARADYPPVDVTV